MSEVEMIGMIIWVAFFIIVALTALLFVLIRASGKPRCPCGELNQLFFNDYYGHFYCKKCKRKLSIKEIIR